VGTFVQFDLICLFHVIFFFFFFKKKFHNFIFSIFCFYIGLPIILHKQNLEFLWEFDAGEGQY
jgi:hypothetical protein